MDLVPTTQITQSFKCLAHSTTLARELREKPMLRNIYRHLKTLDLVDMIHRKMAVHSQMEYLILLTMPRETRVFKRHQALVSTRSLSSLVSNASLKCQSSMKSLNTFDKKTAYIFPLILTRRYLLKIGR